MKKIALSAAAVLAAGPALAHTGHGDANGFWHGLLHPFLGPDHLLAILAVGLWSGFVLPRRVWGGAAAFLAAMAGGAGLARAGVASSAAEPAILASVVAFGLLVAVSRRGQPAALTAASLAAIAAFASAHGYAHATEAIGSAGAYLSGFLIATAGLHLAGIAVARGVSRAGRAGAAQALIGAGIAASGLALIAG